MKEVSWNPPSIVEGEVLAHPLQTAVHSGTEVALWREPNIDRCTGSINKIQITPLPVVCPCGKDGSAFAHGLLPGRWRPFSCAEVQQVAARVEADRRRDGRRIRARIFRLLFGGA